MDQDSSICPALEGGDFSSLPAPIAVVLVPGHRCKNSPSAVAVPIAVPITAATAGVRAYESVPLYADRLQRSATAVSLRSDRYSNAHQSRNNH